MKSLFIYFCMMLMSLGLYAQHQTIVFNKSGKIIKNYEYDRSNDEGIKFNIIIEGIEEHEKENYFLLYQTRNDYNFQANFVNPTKKHHYKKYGRKGFYIDGSKDSINKDRYVNYLLVHVNNAVKPTDSTEISLDTLAKKLSHIDSTFIMNYLKGNPKDVQVRIGSYKTNLADIKKFKKEQQLLTKGRHQLITRKDSLEKQLSVKEKILESLSKLTHASTAASSLLAIGGEIDTLTSQIINYQNKITTKKERLKKLILSKTGKNDSIKKLFVKEIRAKNRIKTSKHNFSAPAFQILHQGVLIIKNHDISEIVYDVHYNTKLDKKEPQLEIARVNPNLPQLTSSSELYAHVINFKPEYLRVAPFKISMTTSSEDSISTESPNNFKGIESIDTSISDLISDVTSIFDNEVGSDSDADETASTETSTPVLDAMMRVLTEGLNSVNKNIVYDGNFISTMSDEDKENFKNSLINFMDADNSLKKYSAILKDKNLDKEVFSDLLEEIRIETESLDDQYKAISEMLALKSKDEANYTEYMLKYPKSFEPNTSTTINLYAQEKSISNYVIKVENGKKSKPSYDISFTNKLLVTDQLPATQGLYRSTLHAGVLLTNFTSYEYERNTSTQQLVEIKKERLEVRPSITYSLYHKKQNLSLDSEDIWDTLHYDLSIDYKDGNLLDHVYLGIGVEPWRTVHLIGGIRLGKADRVDMDRYDFNTNNLEDATIKRFDMGCYFGVSLGVNLIPTLIKSLF